MPRLEREGPRVPRPDESSGIPAVDAAEALHRQSIADDRRSYASFRLGRIVAENEVLRRTAAELQERLATDEATGLLNRHGLMRAYDEMRELLRRDAGQRLLFLFLDADDFKRVNSDYGYSAGDEVIRVMGQRLREHRDKVLREGDVIGRWGGDEFVVLALAPQTSLSERLVDDMKTRLRRGVEGVVRFSDAHHDKVDIPVRLSGGGVVLGAADADYGFEEVVNATKLHLDADKAARKGRL